MNTVKKIKQYGIRESCKKIFSRLERKVSYQYHLWRVRNAPQYQNPTSEELAWIEQSLSNLGIRVCDYSPPHEEFFHFKSESLFPVDYHGGINGGVWDEKLLEHWIAFQRLGLKQGRSNDIYVDVAAASSPWAKILRDRFAISAFAIDIGEVGSNYKDLPYYRIENATSTTFDNQAITGASLQCAYEMFMGDDDTNFIKEIARILKPGGKVIILPLYMHTHYCAYSTPEYYGKGYSNSQAKEYVRCDCFGVPSSRKYNAEQLKKRVLEPIKNLGMNYQLLALRNKSELGQNIYCHFILEITK